VAVADESTVWALGSFLSLGLVGAAHCAGMCGGFAVAVSASAGPGRARALRRQLVYTGGKALSYAVLGLVLARAGEAITARGSWRDALAWVAGGAMIAMGVASLWPRARGWRPSGRAARLLARARELFGAARQLPGDAGALATGLATGLLPCGLSWGALAFAATRSPLEAFAGMLLFGLGTAPVLVLVGLGWSGISGRFRTLAARAAGPLLILFGLYTGLRGASLFGSQASAAAAGALPECCAEEAAHEHGAAPDPDAGEVSGH